MKNNKNNKGFSLVELIVVVLIMAIIAVALAPQVMKWVNNSRVAKDRQTVDAVVSAAQVAYTDKTMVGDTAEHTVTISTTGADSDNDTLDAAMGKLITLSECKLKSTTSDITFKITAGKVTNNTAESVLANSDLD